MRSVWKSAKKTPSLPLIVLLSVALGFSLAANFYNSASRPAIAAATKAEGIADWRNVFEGISAKLQPSVVNITSEKMVEQRSMMPPDMEDFFNFNPFGGSPRRSAPEKQRQTGTGSGVIVRSDGYILTNNHVVDGADRVTVQLADGRKFSGKVSADPMTDLAVVKIDANNLPAAELADSDKVKVGEWSIAIGNPFHLRNTVTVGVVSAIRKEVNQDDPTPYPTGSVGEVIQTDASINPGNSGGPLVDIDGKVIGINGAIYSQSGGNIGIGFAIPSNTAKFVMDQLISKGKVTRGYLGIAMLDLTPVTSQKLGVKTGVVVQSIEKDSPADKAGMKVMDVITKVNGKAVDNGADLRSTIQPMSPGTQAKITVVRDKAEKTLTVKLEEFETDQVASNSSGDDSLGLSVAPLTEDVAKALKLDADTKGVLVKSVEPGSAADRAGIEPKDVIVEIDNTAVSSVGTFSKIAKQLKKGETAIVVVERGGHTMILEMPLD